MTMSDIGLIERRRSDQIGENPFHLPELANAQPQEEACDGQAEPESRPIRLAFAPEQAETKSVDNADHWIDRIEKAPLPWDDAGAESDRRHIEPQLHQKWNDITEIAILDIERGDPCADPKARYEC